MNTIKLSQYLFTSLKGFIFTSPCFRNELKSVCFALKEIEVVIPSCGKRKATLMPDKDFMGIALDIIKRKEIGLYSFNLYIQ